jgi:hypothetical protein
MLKRELWVAAGLATLVFALLTVWTHYPFLVDDYRYLWKARLPGFSPLTFDYLLVQRPLSALLDYLTFASGVLENGKWLVWVYYFLHSLGVLLIFQYVLNEKIASRTFVIIGTIICLFPGWYEVTLLPLDLPYGLGVLFLGLALWAECAWVQTLLYTLCFFTFESYFMPALALAALRRFRKPAPLLIAIAIYFLTQRLLIARLGIQPKYGPSLANAAAMAKMYFELLYFQSFYKVSWISTAVELGALAWASIELVRKDPGWRQRLAILILLPCVAAAHTLVMSYYAPRAIHGALVLRAVCAGVILAAFARTCPLKWAPAFLVLLAYLGQHGVIVHNRIHNREVMDAKQAEIENELRTCTSPCRISLQGVENELVWDWYMVPGFHAPFVYWIKERMGIQKDVVAD